MKRPAPAYRSGSTSKDVKNDLSSGQLQAIGAIAIAWNEVEFILDQILYSGLNLPGTSWLEIVTRLSLDAKIDLIASAEETHNLSPNIQEVITTSVDALKELKELRNSVIHARVFDAPRAIGENIRRRGKISQVLLTEVALNGLYDRLVILRAELRRVLAVFDLVRNSAFAPRNVNGTDPSALIPEVRQSIAQLRELQAQRQSLVPLPDFPK